MADRGPRTLQTLPPDGQVLEEVISNMREEYGYPATPQEYRLILRVAPEEPDRANGGRHRMPAGSVAGTNQAARSGPAPIGEVSPTSPASPAREPRDAKPGGRAGRPEAGEEDAEDQGPSGVRRTRVRRRRRGRGRAGAPAGGGDPPAGGSAEGPGGGGGED